MGAYWAKVHTQYLSHPKLLGLTPPAKLLHLASILWTAEHLTDGYVAPNALLEVSRHVPTHPRHTRTYVQQLVDRALWDVVPEPQGGWIVHDFTVHNAANTRAAVELARQRTRDRVARHRARQGDLWGLGNDVTDGL
jgi:hypothetical protein